MTSTWKEIYPILNTLRVGFPALEARAVLESAELQDAMLHELARLADEPQELLDGGMLHIVGMLLLGEKRDKRFGATLLKLTSGDEAQVDSLWGDFLTEDWAGAAAAVCDSDALQTFLEAESHSQWARAMAASALTIQVYEGDLDRRSAVDYAIALQERYIGRWLDDADENPDTLILDFLADIVADLGSESELPYIERWFESGLLDPLHTGIAGYRRKLSTPYETRHEEAMQRGERYPRDVIASLSNAYGYSDRQAAAQAPAALWESDRGMFVRDMPKVGRNDPCPCGSGKKFKKCCGR